MIGSHLPGSAYAPSGTDEATAPWSAPDDTRTPYRCVACGKVGAQRYPGSEDDFVDDLDLPLPHAAITPDNHFSCSRSCYSAAMYRAAAEQGWKLDALADAVRTIAEIFDQSVEDFLRTWGGSDALRIAPRLRSEADGLLQILSQQSEPEWLNRPNRDEQLEQRINGAMALLRYPQIRLKVLASTVRSERGVAYTGDFLQSEIAGIESGVDRALRALREAVR